MTTEYKRAAKAALSFSKPLPDAKLRVISLGAGVQSSVMALMAARGEIGPMPDCAIFADTQWEPKEVYTHLDWLETQLPFPVHRVSEGNIREDIIHIMQMDKIRGDNGTPPFFAFRDGKRRGPIRRQCTQFYKIRPIRRHLREALGLTKGQRGPKEPVVEQWIGISTDEVQRLKMAHDKWCANRWPLIETGMSRNDCLNWFNKNYPSRRLSKSACIGCPYHNNAAWREVKANPAQWKDAVEIDRIIRPGSASSDSEWFLHTSGVPLDEVDLSTAADKGQQEFGFLEECDGMCGI